MEKAAKLWRGFKANLVKHYLREGLNPLKKYNYIGEDDWEIFRKSHETDEFKVRISDCLTQIFEYTTFLHENIYFLT